MPGWADAFCEVQHHYDEDGNLQRANRTYDAAGRLLSIVDRATATRTVYTYDLNGNRFTETLTTPGDAHNRSYTYYCDPRGNLSHWDDAVTQLHLNYHYDQDGNLQHAYTDLGYEPDGKNTNNDPAFRFIDHVYTYDAAGRPTGLSQDTTLISGYSYDEAWRRWCPNRA